MRLTKIWHRLLKRDCGVSLCGDAQKPSGHGPAQVMLYWTRRAPDVPSIVSRSVKSLLEVVFLGEWALGGERSGGSKLNKAIIFDIFVATLEHCVQFWIPQYKKTF